MTTTTSSDLVKIPLPEIYDEASNLISFMEAYYEWAEEFNPNQLKDLRDVDETIDEFLIYFKGQYLKDISEDTAFDLRKVIKNADSLYDNKGSKKGIELFFRLLYNADVTIKNPSKDILICSDGLWSESVYLETAVNNDVDISTFVNKTIHGSLSGASAVVDRIAIKKNKGIFFNVLYLTHVSGTFLPREKIVVDDISLSLTSLGSLNSITVVDGGSNNIVGEVYNIESENGFGYSGKAKVVSIEDGLGRVTFKFNSGGSGYQANTPVVVSDKVFRFSSNVALTPGNKIEQLVYNISYNALTGNLEAGWVNFYSNNDVFQGNGYIQTVTTSNSSAGSFLLYSDNSFTNLTRASKFKNVGNTVVGNLASYSSNLASGYIVSSSNNLGGIYDISGTFRNNFYVNVPDQNLRLSITQISTGSAARFSVKGIESTEVNLVNTDKLSGNNENDIPYKYIKLNGGGSGIGSVANVVISSGGSGYTNGTLTLYGGSNKVNTYSVITGGTGYSNNERILVSSHSGIGAVGYILTDGSGSVTNAISISEGNYYSDHSFTIQSSGTGAVLKNNTPSSDPAILTLTTDGSGTITNVVVTDSGSNYFMAPEYSGNANLSINMNFEYGFPKANTNVSDYIRSSLTYDEVQTGVLTGINRVYIGSNYNQTPFIRLRDNYVSSYDKHYYTFNLNQIPPFTLNETVSQNVSSNVYVLGYDNLTGNTSFEIGEDIEQVGTFGSIQFCNSTVIKVGNATGTFTVGPITSFVSSANADIISANLVIEYNNVSGVVENISGNTVTLQPLSLSKNFKIGQMFNATGGLSANVVSFYENNSQPRLGEDSDVTATVKSASGIVSTLEIIDSGFNYFNANTLILTSDRGSVIYGTPVVSSQGISEGRWLNDGGFIGVKYLYDGDYYQYYSYELQTLINLDRYGEIFKKVMHTAGTKLFSATSITSINKLDVTNAVLQITQGSIQGTFDSTGVQMDATTISMDST